MAEEDTVQTPVINLGVRVLYCIVLYSMVLNCAIIVLTYLH
jgi:hypothetical protein